MFLSKYFSSEAPPAAQENPANSAKMLESTASLLSVMSGKSSAKVEFEKQSTDEEILNKSSSTDDAICINEALVKSQCCSCPSFPKIVLQVFTKCSPTHRQDIADAYFKLYGQKLVTALKSQTKPMSIMRLSIVAVATPRADFYAQELHKAVADSGITYKSNANLLEMLSTIRFQDLIDANYAYWIRYCVSLEYDIKSNIFGFFQRLLVNLSLPRRSNLPANREQAKADALMLHEAGSDKTSFIRMFTTRSYEQLNLIFEEYRTISGCPIDVVIVRFFNRKLKFGFLDLVKVAKGRTAFVADKIYKAFRDGSKAKMLRLIRINSDHKDDIRDINNILQRRRGTTLKNLIRRNSNGDFKKLLLALVDNSIPDGKDDEPDFDE